MKSEQVKAARSLLGWSQKDLAETSGVGIATIQRLEASRGVLSGRHASAVKLQTTLESAGIKFFEDEKLSWIGVTKEN